MTTAGRVVVDDFDGSQLDTDRWLPHYLPTWSSRGETAACYDLRDSCLELFIPEGQGLWCGDDHRPRLRVSGMQTGSFSGLVGSTRGQQPYREGLIVAEEQPEFWGGWTVSLGRTEMRARADLDADAMVSLWMVGREIDPAECAEVCVMEVFGSAARQTPTGPSTGVGTGLHQFRDPHVPEDFAVTDLPLDISDFHTCAGAPRLPPATDGRRLRLPARGARHVIRAAVRDRPRAAHALVALLIPVGRTAHGRSHF